MYERLIHTLGVIFIFYLLLFDAEPLMLRAFLLQSLQDIGNANHHILLG